MHSKQHSVYTYTINFAFKESLTNGAFGWKSTQANTRKTTKVKSTRMEWSSDKDKHSNSWITLHTKIWEALYASLTKPPRTTSGSRMLLQQNHRTVEKQLFLSQSPTQCIMIHDGTVSDKQPTCTVPTTRTDKHLYPNSNRKNGDAWLRRRWYRHQLFVS